MILTWMAYSMLASVLLASAAALLEHFAPWLAGRRRLAWLAVVVASLFFMAAATASPTRTLSGFRILPEVAVRSPIAEPVPKSPAALPRENVIANGAGRQASSVVTRADGGSVRVDAMLVLAWLVASAVCLCVLLISAWRVSRMRKAWRESIVAGVPVLVSHDVGPAVIGLVHHGIVVPAWVESLDESEQRTVMTHEREHVRAGDPMLLWGATLLVSLAPWNLPMWYALRRLRHAIEIDCDARVLRSRPDAHAYCTLLIDVGERTLAGIAPVAALAEPATLLERRIDAMTTRAGASRRHSRLATLAALTLVAAACWTPRPEVAPRARVNALVLELGSLLARDSVRTSLSATERARADQMLARAKEAEVDALDTLTSTQYGARAVRIAHQDFPSAFDRREDAALVTVLYDAKGRVVAKDFRQLPLGDVFDVAPGTPPRKIGSRNSEYLLSRVVATHPKLQMSGTQSMAAAPSTVFLIAVLGDGERVPAFLPVAPQKASVSKPDEEAQTFENVSGRADSIARALYPEAFRPHDGVIAVGLLFSSDGRLVRHAGRALAHDDVFSVPVWSGEKIGEAALGGDEILSKLFDGLPSRFGRWSVTAHRSRVGPALAFAVLPAGAAIPTLKAEAAEVSRVSGTASEAHRNLLITLSLINPYSEARTVLVYATDENAVEARVTAGSLHGDTLRVLLEPKGKRSVDLAIDLGPGGELHFLSADGGEFSMKAVQAGKQYVLENHGREIILESGARVLRTIK